MTFRKYDGATNYHIFLSSSHTWRSKMTTAKPLRSISLLINNIHQGSTGSVTPRDEISKDKPTSHVWAQGNNGLYYGCCQGQAEL